MSGGGAARKRGGSKTGELFGVIWRRRCLAGKKPRGGLLYSSQDGVSSPAGRGGDQVGQMGVGRLIMQQKHGGCAGRGVARARVAAARSVEALTNAGAGRGLF